MNEKQSKAQIAELRALLADLLGVVPEPVCHRLHHRPAEYHEAVDQCPAEARCQAIIRRAQAAITKATQGA